MVDHKTLMYVIFIGVVNMCNKKKSTDVFYSFFTPSKIQQLIAKLCGRLVPGHYQIFTVVTALNVIAGGL